MPGLTTDAGSLFRLLRSRVCVGGGTRLPADGGIPAALISTYAAALALRVSVVRHRADGLLDWFADPGNESVGAGTAQHRWAILMSDGLAHCTLVGVVMACHAEDALRVWVPARHGLSRATTCSGGVAEAWPAGARIGGGPGEGTPSGSGVALGSRGPCSRVLTVWMGHGAQTGKSRKICFGTRMGCQRRFSTNCCFEAYAK